MGSLLFAVGAMRAYGSRCTCVLRVPNACAAYAEDAKDDFGRAKQPFNHVLFVTLHNKNTSTTKRNDEEIIVTAPQSR